MANVDVTAEFALNTFTLKYAAGTGGTLTGNASQTVNYGADGTPVTAVADAGYHFVKWSDDSTANPRTDTNVMANVDVTANFAQTIYDLTIAVDPAGGGTTTPAAGVHNYGAGTVVDVSATPATGYHFVEWSGACAGSGACSVTMDAAKMVVAHFAVDTFTLSYAAGAGGTLTGNTSQTVA